MKNERQIPEVLHYAIWFNFQSSNYEPLAVFNTKAEADFYKEEFEDHQKSYNQQAKVIIQSMNWQQFCAFARNAEIQQPQATVSLPLTWTQVDLDRFKVAVGMYLKSQGLEP